MLARLPPSITIIINLFIDQNELSSTRENDIKQMKRKKTKLSMNKKKQGEIWFVSKIPNFFPTIMANVSTAH